MEESTHRHTLHNSHMPRPEALSKLVPPLRARTDPETRDPVPLRDRSRNPLIGSQHASRSHKHKHRHSHSHRHAAKETIQSAFELRPPVSFEQLLRRDKKSPDSSRHGSTVAGQDHGAEKWDHARQQTEALRQITSPETVEKVHRDNEGRQKELRESLQEVEELGMTSTRRLDDTYYKLLERMDSLRQTVSSIQDLAKEGQIMQDRFHAATWELRRKGDDNLSGFNDFNDQEQTIRFLVGKLEESKNKTLRLNRRLELAKTRVDGVEKGFHDRQARRRRQWGMIWASVVASIVLIFALLVARHHKELEDQLDGVGKTIIRAGDAVEDVASPLTSRLIPTKSEDPYLHDLFEGVS